MSTHRGWFVACTTSPYRKKNWSQMTRSSEERTGTSTEPGDADADAPLIYCTPSESIGRSLLTLQASVPPFPHHCVKDSLCKTSDRLIRVLVEDCQWVVHWLCPFVARGSHMVRGVPCGKEEVDFHRFGAKLKFISYDFVHVASAWQENQPPTRV